MSTTTIVLLCIGGAALLGLIVYSFLTMDEDEKASFLDTP